MHEGVTTCEKGERLPCSAAHHIMSVNGVCGHMSVRSLCVHQCTNNLADMRELRACAHVRELQTLPSALSIAAAADHFLRRSHAARIERGVVEPSE